MTGPRSGWKDAYQGKIVSTAPAKKLIESGDIYDARLGYFLTMGAMRVEADRYEHSMHIDY